LPALVVFGVLVSTGFAFLSVSGDVRRLGEIFKIEYSWPPYLEQRRQFSELLCSPWLILNSTWYCIKILISYKTVTEIKGLFIISEEFF